MKANLKLLLFIGFLLYTNRMFAQAEHYRITASLGTSAYNGDLVQGAPVAQEFSPDFSIGLAYEIANKFRARLNTSFLGVKGDDKYSTNSALVARNLNFKSFVWEVALLGEYDLLDRRDYAIIPYVFGGPAFYHFNPTTIDRNGNKVNLHDWDTEGEGLPGYPAPYHRAQINLQFGFGTRYEITDGFSLGFEFCYRKLFTDYLDDVSGKYVDPAVIDYYVTNPAVALEMKQLSFRGDEINPAAKVSVTEPRGNPSKKDVYYSFQLTATYCLGADPYNQKLIKTVF